MCGFKMSKIDAALDIYLNMFLWCDFYKKVHHSPALEISYNSHVGKSYFKAAKC